jgi:hypothetical protein
VHIDHRRVETQEHAADAARSPTDVTCAQQREPDWRRDSANAPSRGTTARIINRIGQTDGDLTFEPEMTAPMTELMTASLDRREKISAGAIAAPSGNPAAAAPASAGGGKG